VKARTLALSAALLALAPRARAEGGDDEAMGRRVQALLHAHQGQIFACVQREAVPAEGEMLVRVFVGERGQVGRAEVLKDDAQRPQLAECLMTKVRTWDLSPLAAAVGDQVVFPLAFRPERVRYHLAASGARPLPLPGGQGTAALLLDGTPAEVALDRISIKRGAIIPPHRHDGSDEILYVIGGRGKTTIAGEGFTVAAGDTFYIPKGVEHSLTVDADLEAVQVYAPRGPEQRFKPRAEKR
jgi:quercetin dioxygenase-like cupin family protein